MTAAPLIRRTLGSLNMKDIVTDAALVAYCGLYCAACGRHRRGRCPGCHENTKATWCGIRSCCIENGYKSCADCNDFEDPTQCGKFHNLVSRFFGFIFRSNRPACIKQIRELGIEGHARDMAEQGRQSIRR